MFFFYLFRLSLFLFIVVLVVVETDVLIGHGGVEVGMRVGKLGLVGCGVRDVDGLGVLSCSCVGT